MSDFKAKIAPKSKNRLGTQLGSLQRSPDPLAGFKGPTFKGRGVEVMEREETGGRDGRGREGREGKGSVVESKNILKIDPGQVVVVRVT